MNYDLTDEELKKVKWNPLTNKKAISIMQDPDGNWRGFMWKNGKLVQARQADPGIVMQMLITHAG